ncbi:MAG: DNA repair protein RecN, partial [Aquificae bacterium]|nr:DNA repair protein RecN [Aquificota bacterium]
KEKAKILSKEVEKHIKELAMPEGRFTVKIEETEFGADGKDRVVFLFSANKGFEPAPIDETASGGELSRLSLALKLVIGSDVDCMIFDEIDTGIGGKTAGYMAQKLKKLSEDYQVILITHLPQIAVHGDRHFYIEKMYSEGGTTAVIKQVEGEERIREIARMLSGAEDRETLELAKQILEKAGKV